MDGEIERLRAKHYNAAVAAVRDVHAGLRILQVRPDWGRLDYRPVQYTVLGLGAWEPCLSEPDAAAPGECEMIRRAYSISSSMLDATGKLLRASDWQHLEFYVTLASGARPNRPRLTPRLFRLRPGDRLYVSPHAHGRYTLDGVAEGDQIVFLATGTGEAPHNAMLAERLASGSRQPIASVVCVRHRIDLAYLAVHRELERHFANYRYLPLTTREPENVDPQAPGYVGTRHLQDYIESGDFERAAGLQLDPLQTHVYLCGNPAMVGLPVRGAELAGTGRKGMVEILQSRGFRLNAPGRPGNLHCERFW